MYLGAVYNTYDCCLLAIGFTDKSAGGKFSEEFEEASQKLQEYCGLLHTEVDERTTILEMVIECMEEQKQFYTKVQTVYEVCIMHNA